MLQEPWRFEFLGKTLLRSGKEEHSHFRERKIVSLLAMLCLQESNSLTREQCMERLWPDEDPEVSKNRFRVTLFRLRQLLEPAGVEAGTVLRSGRIAVSLNLPAYSADVVEFRTTLEAAAKRPPQAERISLLERAAALYGGEFLPGFDDSWIEVERTHLAALHFQGLRYLVRALMAAPANPARAISYARTAVSLEPYEEDAYCDLMRLYAAAGNYSEALRQFDFIEKLFSDELGTEPSRSTLRLVQQLRELQRTGSPAESDVGKLPDLFDSASVAPGEKHSGSITVSSPEPQVHADPVSIPRLRVSALPLRLTRFFGREAEIEKICELLSPDSDTRLVTILGTGGMGKTRLSLEIAERLQTAYNGRVFFVALADVYSVWNVAAAIIEAMQLIPDPASAPLSQVVQALNESRSLMVLDNLEQLLPELRDLVRELVECVPTLHCLATSRRIIGLDGEHEFPLKSLPVPLESATAADLRVTPGAALFIDRARAARADFALTDRNSGDIAWLCRKLEGLPLAIELAAARVRAISVKEIRAEMTDMLEWLVDLRGSKEARHRSLRSAIQWSYQLLEPVQQRALDALSIFVGGFTAQAAQAIFADMVTSKVEAQTILEELCAASLITANSDSSENVRFLMLESLRAFGAEQLVKSGFQGAIRSRHIAWCLDQGERGLQGSADARRDLSREEANLRAALQHGLSQASPCEDQLVAARLAVTLPSHWSARGGHTEGRRWLRGALDLQLPDDLRASAFTRAGLLAIQQADYDDGLSLTELGKTIFDRLPDARGIAECHFNLGLIAFRRGQWLDADAQLDAALSGFTEFGAKPESAASLVYLGLLAWYRADDDTARARLQEALAIYQSIGSARGIAECLLRLGNVARNRGDIINGRALISDALEAYRELDDFVGIATSLHDLGLVGLMTDDAVMCEDCFRQSLAMFKSAGMKAGCASAMGNLGELLARHGKVDEGVTLLTESVEVYKRLGDKKEGANALRALGVATWLQGRSSSAVELIREALVTERELGSPTGVAACLAELGLIYLSTGDVDEAEQFLREAVTVSKGDTVPGSLGHCLLCYSRLLGARGDWKRVVRLLGVVAQNLEPHGRPIYHEDVVYFDELQTEARSELGAAFVDASLLIPLSSEELVKLLDEF